MIAIKGNKELKIIEVEKEQFVEEGYTILDENTLKVIEEPTNATISKSEFETKLNEELEKKFNEELDKKVEEAVKEKDDKIAELEKLISELTKPSDKNK